jgi:hypothetical protein
MKTIYTLFLLLVLSVNAYAQNDNPTTSQAEKAEKSTRVKNILGLKVGITDPLLAGVYERLFTPLFRSGIGSWDFRGFDRTKDIYPFA